MLMSCMKHLAAKLPELHRLHLAAALGTIVFRQMGSIQGTHTYLMQGSHVIQHHSLPKSSSTTPAVFTGSLEERTGPNISRLAPHLQLEWDHAANAHLGRMIIAPLSNSKAWWRSNMCRNREPHKWLARISARTRGAGCPYDVGKAVCPCNDLAHNHPEVAAEWDQEANGARTPETVTANSNTKAVWRCGLCGHRWSARVSNRTHGRGCPECAYEARRVQSKQPSISVGAQYLLVECDLEANKRYGWHPDLVTLMSHKKMHWVKQDECKLGLVHRWQASPNARIGQNVGSPFPSGNAVCACNSLAVQCPEAANLWDFASNGGLTPSRVAVKSSKRVTWRGPDGRQWQQKVHDVVNNVRRRRISQLKQHIKLTS